MILEVARIHVKPGAEHQFEQAVAHAIPLFRMAEGCRGMDIHRSIEQPDCYVLFVKWETLEAHTVGFRGSDAFGKWRALVSPHFVAPPQVEHFQLALQGF